MHNKENPVTRQRKLHFEEDELWTMLPQSLQERCRTLWKELLASMFPCGATTRIRHLHRICRGQLYRSFCNRPRQTHGQGYEFVNWQTTEQTVMLSP